MKTVLKRVVYPVIAIVVLVSAGYLLFKSCGPTTCKFISDYQSAAVSKFQSLFPKVILVLFLFLLFMVLHKSIVGSFFASRFSKKEENGRHSGLLKLSSLIWWVIWGVIVISIFSGGKGGLVSSVGLIGFGLTIALQKPILNFVGWLTITLTGMYKEGDRIEIIGNVKGDVKKIQVMSTVLDGTLENSDNRSFKEVIFPNEMVLTGSVRNYTQGANYIVEELVISITYESNYHKAIEILRRIVEYRVVQNKNLYLKKVERQKRLIDNFIEKMVSKKLTKEEEKKLDIEAERLKKDKSELENAAKIFELGEEFKPNIWVELKDSSIDLIAQFITPYNTIKKNRTEVNLAFLNAVSNEDDIEIAYPHMEIVHNPKPKKIVVRN